jgi:hypothetical protein
MLCPNVYVSIFLRADLASYEERVKPGYLDTTVTSTAN